MGTMNNITEEHARSNKSSDIDRVKHQIEAYKAKIENERNNISSLNEQIIQLELDSLVEKRSNGSDYSTNLKEAKIDTEKNIAIDRLNKKMVGLNKKISSNKDIRKKIDEMRLVRCR